MQPNEKIILSYVNKDSESLINLIDGAIKSTTDVVGPKIDIIGSINEITSSTTEKLESLMIQVNGFARENYPDFESIMKEGLHLPDHHRF